MARLQVDVEDNIKDLKAMRHRSSKIRDDEEIEKNMKFKIPTRNYI